MGDMMAFWISELHSNSHFLLYEIDFPVGVTLIETWQSTPMRVESIDNL